MLHPSSIASQWDQSMKETQTWAPMTSMVNGFPRVAPPAELRLGVESG